MAHFVKLGLEIINLAQNVSKAGNFSVGGGNGGLSARGLVESGALGLRGELGRYDDDEHQVAKGAEEQNHGGGQGCAFLSDRAAVKRT